MKPPRGFFQNTPGALGYTYMGVQNIHTNIQEENIFLYDTYKWKNNEV